MIVQTAEILHVGIAGLAQVAVTAAAITAAGGHPSFITQPIAIRANSTHLPSDTAELMRLAFERRALLTHPVIVEWSPIARQCFDKLQGSDRTFALRVHAAAFDAGERGEILPVRWMSYARSIAC